MNSSRMHPCELDFTISDIFLTTLYSLVLVVGMPLNCWALRVLISGIHKKIVLSIYMANLALADLLQLLTLPFWIHYFRLGRKWDLGSAACASVGLGFVINLYAKEGFLCLIAMERYVGVVHVFRYHGWKTRLRATQISVCAWAFVILVCTLGYIALWKDTAHNNSTLCYEGYPTGQNYPHFKLCTVGLSFIAPSLLMGFFYSSILLKLRKMHSIPLEEKRRIGVLLAFTVVTFFLISGPHQIISFYKYLVETTKSYDLEDLCRQERSILLYFQITLGCTTLGNIVNPLVYVLLSKDVAADFMRNLRCLPSCHRHRDVC